MKAKTFTQKYHPTNRYKRERELLIRAFIAHQASNPVNYFYCNIGNGILLEGIAEAGSVSRWVSLQIAPPDCSVLPVGRYKAGDYIYEHCQCPNCI